MTIMSTKKYSKYRASLFEDFDVSDLLDELSDFFLDSGFLDMYGFHELSDDMMQSLREAILRALVEQGRLSEEDIEQLLGDAENFEDSELRKLLDQIIDQMQEEGYVQVTPPDPNLTAAGVHETDQMGSRFELLPCVASVIVLATTSSMLFFWR